MKAIAVMALGGMPILFFVSLFGKDVLAIIYGYEYAAVSIPFAIIFCSELIRTISLPFASLFLAVGHPEMHRYFTGVRALLILILIYPAVKYFGLTGAAVASLVAMVLSFALQVNRVSLLIDFNVVQFSKIIGTSIVISFPVVATWLVTPTSLAMNTAVSMSSGILGCCLSYGLAGWIFFKSWGGLSSR